MFNDPCTQPKSVRARVIARPPDIEIQFFQLILPILSYYWLNDLNIEI